MHHLKSGTTHDHLWRDITIREFLAPGVQWLASLVEVDVPPRVEHPTARSVKCETFYYCLSGAIEFDVGGRSVDLRPGDLIVLQTNEWYSYRNAAAETARLLSFNAPAYDPAATEIREP